MSEVTQAVTKNPETGAWDITYGRPGDIHTANMPSHFNLVEITKVISHLTRLIGEANDDAYACIVARLSDPEVFSHLSNLRMAVYELDPHMANRPRAGRQVRPTRPRYR